MMYGAIIGDLAGSIYEFEQTKKVSSICIDQLIEENSFYSDDTILTIAVLDAILNDQNYEKYIKSYMKKYMNYKPNFKPYFKSTFSPQLLKWYDNQIIGNSKGNGAMMRISPVGYLFHNESDIIKHSMLATLPSHDSEEAIEAAQIVSRIIYYARLGMPKEEIISEFFKKAIYHPFSKFNTTCSDTLPNCLYALFSSNTFEEAIRKIISFGGDTDTNACIVGSMAEALYGVEEELISLIQQKLPIEFTDILKKGYRKVRKLSLYK